MHIYLYVYISDCFVAIVQVTQQIYVTKEWVRNARDEVDAEAHSRANAKKMLGALKEKDKNLANKLKESDKECQSALAGLKNAEAQAENQRKLLYTTELNLATKKQKVLDFKAKLQKVKDVAWVARGAAEVAVNTSYEHGVADTEARLVEEVVMVCRDYVAKSWGVAMDKAGVPANSELRKYEHIFFPEDIRQIP